jgi:hypothetical protein
MRQQYKGRKEHIDWGNFRNATLDNILAKVVTERIFVQLFYKDSWPSFNLTVRTGT